MHYTEAQRTIDRGALRQKYFYTSAVVTHPTGFAALK